MIKDNPNKWRTELDELAKACEEDLYLFASTVEPHRMYGDVHRELFRWWTRPGCKDNLLCLLPRDHQKSHCMAVLTAWLITRDPSITILYISATSLLAEKQLYEIKNLLTSKIYSRLWPDMVNREEGKRTKWTTEEIIVDHPIRKAEAPRDPTVKAAGLTTNITGLHCSVACLDDIVAPVNAYTAEGRQTVENIYSQLASIQTTGAREYVVGTRYHPSDLYNILKDMKEAIFNDEGDIEDYESVYEIFEKVVEEDGIFLWPREMRSDGKGYGFNQKELERKKVKYLDRTQFYAQYYNNPNNMEDNRLDRSRFQYYDRKFLVEKDGYWFYRDKRLNVFASIDFAFSTKLKADFTAIVVVGVDLKGNIYVLDIDRFKTRKMEDYFKAILDLHHKWMFRRLRAEITVAQAAIVEYLKDRAREMGMSLSIDEHRPTSKQGSKEERIASILEPRYENQTIWHFKGGYCGILEEELILSNPPHDDVKDALASVVEIAKGPKGSHSIMSNVTQIEYHPRFGGIRF